MKIDKEWLMIGTGLGVGIIGTSAAAMGVFYGIKGIKDTIEHRHDNEDNFSYNIKAMGIALAISSVSLLIMRKIVKP